MRFIDLFSGIGGFRLRMESVGHSVLDFVRLINLLGNLISPFFQTEGEIEFHDIRDVSDDEFKNLEGKSMSSVGIPLVHFQS